jgi:hypothetical protein
MRRSGSPKRNNCSVAADYYRRSLSLTPTTPHVDLGKCLLQLGQIEAGYDCFRTAPRGDPKRYSEL